MNEFSAKKLGEVLAFGLVLEDTIERSGPALKEALGDELSTLSENNKKHIESVRQIAKEKNVEEITLAKAEKTKSKLIQMRDLYIGDDWDNPVELMEWGGFFHGAAIVHWQLVLGVAETLNDSVLKKLADDASEQHEDILEIAGKILKESGKKRAI